ncbi:MAG TPA: Crp/Fnr family transcriptional regulator [Flavobacteriaceae bacterium]|nr:Crp/Fnr family transcriptional regulator [Flavobacteriaceae bacterium]
MFTELEKRYESIFEKELLQEIESVSYIKHIKEGQQLIDIGETIKYMPLLLKGAIKILREDEKGDDLVLYFIEMGDTCAMTLSCCVGNKKSEVRAIAETDATVVMIPIEKMDLWMGKYKSWQAFILQSYQERLTEMLEAIDTLAFLKMDERLFKYLKDKAMVNHDENIKVTHQDIANDLHTSRVVVSRLLKTLEREQKIKLHRNSITVLDL